MFTKYYESGYVPLPISPRSKMPVKGAAGFNEWAHDGIPRALIDKFEDDYPIEKGFGIGVLCGRASNIVVVDIDTDDFEVMHACPPSPIRRRGKKGEARFFRYNPDLQNCRFERTNKKTGLTEGVDILVERKYIIVPPSVHPDTKKPYVWLTPDELLTIAADDLPELTCEEVDRIGLALGHDPRAGADSSSVELAGEFQSPDGVRCPHGSYARVKALAHGLIAKCTPLEEAVRALLNYDKAHHFPVGYFEDTRRHTDFGADPYSNAVRLYGNFLKSTNEQRLRRGLLPQVPEVVSEIDIDEFLKDPPKFDNTFKPYPAPRGAMLEFVNYCELMGKGRQDAIGLGGAIAFMSAIASNRFRSQVRGLNVWPNLYVLNLGYSSFGKDTSQRLIDDLLAETNLVGSANYRSGTSMVQDLPEQQERIDLIDECSWLLKAMHEGDTYQSEMVEILSLLFSRSSTRFNGIASAGKGGRHGAAHNPCVNLLASTTPAGFKESVNKAMAAKGLMPRFVTFFQKEIGEYKGQQDIGSAMAVKEGLAYWVGAMLEIEKPWHTSFEPPRNYLAKRTSKNAQDLSMGAKYDPHYIAFEDNAHVMWLEYEKQNHYKSAKEPDQFESAFYGRFAEIAAKLALLDCISQCEEVGRLKENSTKGLSDVKITIDNLDWAISVIETCWHNAMPLYEQATAENLFERDTSRVLEIIREAKGVITSSDLTKKTQWLKPGQRQGIIETLLLAEQIETGTNAKGRGRPTTYYTLPKKPKKDKE